jgi:GntR family transcriptional regulator
LDRAQPLPLYYRIKQDLLEAIDEGRLREGDRVPSERELTERYGVSRMTARHALAILEQEGFLRRVQGKGSFVAPPKLEQTLVGLTSFTEEMHRRGLVPSTQVRLVEEIRAGERVAEHLGAQPDERVYMVERLRLASGDPMALERVYLPTRLVHGLPEMDLTGSLYELLADTYGLRLHNAVQSLEAVLADPEEAAVLHVPLGSPLLAMTRVSYSAAGEPIEYVRSLYRADRYRFTVTLSRKEDGTP